MSEKTKNKHKTHIWEYSVNEKTFMKAMENYPKQFLLRVSSISAYVFGYKDKHVIRYTESEMVVPRLHLSSLGILPEDEKKDGWYQVELHLNVDQKEDIVDSSQVMSSVLKVERVIRKYYTQEEKIQIFNEHSAEEQPGEIIRLSATAEEGKILKFENVIYYDANGAYASELIQMFPKCEKEFRYMFEHRHDNNNAFKNCFNFYVGCLTQNEQKRETIINSGKTPRTIYPDTRHYIVQNISKKMRRLIKEAQGYELYAHTDGVFIQNPKNRIPGTKELGGFKIEAEGAVYTYRAKNYTILQYTDVDGEKQVKGFGFPTFLKDQVDLEKGWVVDFIRIKREDGLFDYKDIIRRNLNEDCKENLED